MVFGVFFVLLTLSCESDDPDDGSALVRSGILGRWELQTRSFDGITPLIIEVGQYLTLLEDRDRDDLKGEFLAISPGSETEGVFELDPSMRTIRFEFRQRALIYAYIVNGQTLMFDYEEDGTNINEVWVRADLIP